MMPSKQSKRNTIYKDVVEALISFEGRETVSSSEHGNRVYLKYRCPRRDVLKVLKNLFKNLGTKTFTDTYVLVINKDSL